MKLALVQMNLESDTLYRFYQKAKEHKYYISPNVYLEQGGADQICLVG